MIISTALRQPWIVVLLTGLLLMMVPFAFGGCASGGGGGDDDQDATVLLDRAFDEPVPSADVDLDLQLDIEGLAGFEDPLRLGATGPYVRAERSLPRLDLDIALEAQGAGQAIEAGLLSTGDRVFLKFGGTFYEQPADQVAQTNRQLARGDDNGAGSFSDLGLNAREWIVDAEVDGEEEIGGVATRHVAGTLDVEAALTDLNGLVRRSAGALGEAGEAARPLGREEIERLAQSVDDPTFDVYVGKDDDIVRRVSLRIDVDVPEAERKDVGGITGASIRLTAQLNDVGGDQRVEAPASARPLSELTSQIGSLARLDGFERYGECLDAADPNDSAAIASCRALLP